MFKMPSMAGISMQSYRKVVLATTVVGAFISGPCKRGWY
jgi:hypothetical protein